MSEDNKPKVSIITVSYNAAKTIEQTICSVLEQSYKNIEYLIVDGQSVDGTQKIIDKYRDSIDYYVSEPDEGIYDAMNKGISHATGDLIGIINSDDWYEKDAVEKIVDCFCHTDAEIVYGRIWVIYQNGQKEYSKNLPLDQMWYTLVPPHPSVFIKRNVYDRFGLFNTEYKIAADYELLLRFYVKKVRFEYIDEVIADFRYGGVSTIKYLECYKEARQISLSYIDFCPCKDINQKIEKQFSKVKFNALVDENQNIIFEFLKQRFPDISKGTAIWGTGIWGKKIYQVLTNANVPILLFADNNEDKWGSKMENIEIFSPEKLRDYCGYIIIAIRDHAEAVCEQLSALNNSQMQWITLEEIQNGIIAM